MSDYDAAYCTNCGRIFSGAEIEARVRVPTWARERFGFGAVWPHLACLGDALREAYRADWEEFATNNSRYWCAVKDS